MTWTYSSQGYTEYTRVTWNESAAAYDVFAQALGPYRSDLVRSAAPRPGERFLDLATGPGEPALTIAPQLGSRGQLTGVDLSRQMIGIARRKAAARRIRNVRFLTMDCSRLSFPSRTFDAVVSAFGFQIFTDPDRVAEEAHRVLKPSGRLVASIWGPGDRVPVLNALIGPMLKHAEPDETGYLPSPFEMGERGQLIAFLRKAGFHQAREHRVRHFSYFRNPSDYLSSITRATPIGHSLSEETRRVQAAVQRETRKNLRRWTHPSGVKIPGEAVIVTARR